MIQILRSIIYLVIEYGGQWEESWERPVCAYRNREAAERHVREIRKAIRQEDEQRKRCADCPMAYHEGNGLAPGCQRPDGKGGCTVAFHLSMYDRKGAEIHAVELVEE